MHIFHNTVVCSVLLEKKGYNLVTFQYLKWAYNKDGEILLTKACSDMTMGNGFKLKEGRFRLNIKKAFFMMRVARLGRSA